MTSPGEQNVGEPHEGFATRDLVAEDLRVLIGLRSRGAIRDRELTHLHRLLDPADLAHPDTRYAALQRLIHRGLDQMPDGDHRRAATSLLAFDTGRWRPLKTRGSEAAANFALGWDAYRRRRDSTGVSLLMDTLTEVADHLVEESVPSGDASPPPSPTSVGTAPGVEIAPVTIHRAPDPARTEPAVAAEPPRRRWTAVAAGLAVVAAILAAGAWAVARQDAPRDPAARQVNCGNLVEAPGATAAGASTHITRWSDAFESAAASLPRQRRTCASLMAITDGVVHQTLSGGIDTQVSVLMVAEEATPDRPVILLDQAEFAAYRAVSWNEQNPNRQIGLPVRRADVEAGARVVEFTDGVIVQEHPGSRAVAVVQAIWARWVEEGGLDGRLGIPADSRYADVGDALVQEFAGGRIEVDFRTGTVSVIEATDADLELPPIGRGAVLVNRGTSTAWFVDRDGTRHWLPTTDDFSCAVEYHDATVFTDLPASAVATLAQGEPYTCR